MLNFFNSPTARMIAIAAFAGFLLLATAKLTKRVRSTRRVRLAGSDELPAPGTAQVDERTSLLRFEGCLI